MPKPQALLKRSGSFKESIVLIKKVPVFAKALPLLDQPKTRTQGHLIMYFDRNGEIMAFCLTLMQLYSFLSNSAVRYGS
jgi:hypothetical protein